jgi:hypothetical protein
MDDSQSHKAAASAAEGSRPDKRTNHKLRELIDEMMASIRTASRRDLWSAEERAQYENELSMIMQRVRGEAVLLPERANSATGGER